MINSVNACLKLRLCCFADVHVHDDESLRQTLVILDDVIKRYQPDFMICLGDTFDNGDLCRRYGPRLHYECHKRHPNWLFCYGNHDGEGFDDGYARYCDVFKTAQHAINVKEYRLVSFADMSDFSDGEKFSLRNTLPGTIVCCHGNQSQRHIGQLAMKGARLVLTGHKHFFHVQQGGDARCEQMTLPPLRFGGMNSEPAGCAIIDVGKDNINFQWIESQLPPFPLNERIWVDEGHAMTRKHATSHFEGSPDQWLICPPLKVGNREWKGGPSKLQYRIGGELRWERSYGVSWVDNCPCVLRQHQGREYLVMGATWLGMEKRMGVKGLESLLVADAESGEELYRLPVVGVSTPPTIMDGTVYVVGQWREIIAAELATGKILWRQRSQTDSDSLSWHDNRVGGGWSVCPAAVGKHVWTANSRGDLFGYDRSTGKPVFVYPSSIAQNNKPTCTYASCLGFNSRRHRARKTAYGDVIFTFNDCSVHDASGQLLPPRIRQSRHRAGVPE